ncbi:hypothetical protein ccbrp13_63870 [Ktedonobacteria bacterium brp13]|nr:hypothetical protein ccbrp13_63870 [Ktedonobacteria bacterium brp13]
MMNQTQTQKQASHPTARRVNFSDDNRALHLQMFFQWLPEEFHEIPPIDWTQLPSRVMGTLVNAVGKSPFAGALAIAAVAGLGSTKEAALRRQLAEINSLLNDVRASCGVHCVAELTSDVWRRFIIEKEHAPKDYYHFVAYGALTEAHLPDYLEELNPHQYARIEPHVLPRLPRKFRQQYLPTAAHREREKRQRKGKSDILAPLHTLLVALVQLRKQSTQRLWAAYHEALAQAQASDVELPLSFSYEDELVMVNREAQTVADIRLTKRSVTLRFMLWDPQSWVKKHPEDYQRCTKGAAKYGQKRFSKQQFFVQCLNPAEELLWFGDLVKYRLFHAIQPLNITLEDAQQRQRILAQFGTVQGLACSRDGILTPGHDFTITLSNAIARTNALLFDAESLCRGALFASALAILALTNGSRMCELLQVSADRFKARPYVVRSDEQPSGEERVMHLQHLLPKGKFTEAERKLFPISDGARELLREVAGELRRAHENHIPVVQPHRYNTKREELSAERYLFQWDATPDGKLGVFSPEDVTNLLRFILHGLEFYTKEGEPFSVSVHLLRHVMATVARHEHGVPIEAVARVLHHECRPGIVPVSTAYYSEETEDQAWVAFASFQTNLEVRAASLLVEWPSTQEIADMDEGLRESFERWHTLLETAFGFCGNIDLCPRGYNRTLCIGCPHLVVDPRKRKNVLHWLGVYMRLAEELEAAGNEVDARQYRLLVRDLEKHLKNMEFLQAAIDDGTRRPIFLLQPATSCEGVIVDAQA